MASTIVHVEVVGKDGHKLQNFHTDVLGWELDTNNPGGYGMYRFGSYRSHATALAASSRLPHLRP